MAKTVRGERLSPGRVYSEGFGALRRHAVLFVVLAFVLNWAPHEALNKLPQTLFQKGHPDAVALFSQLGRALLRSLSDDVLGLCVIWLALSPPGGWPGALRSMIGAVLPRLPWLIPLVIITDAPSLISVLIDAFEPELNRLSASSVLGAFFWSMVPLVLDFWLLAWIGVADPVFIQERRSVFGTLSRSASLMHGQRWRFMVIVVPLIFASLAAFVLVDILKTNLTWAVLKGDALTEAFLAILGVLSSILCAVSYRELKRIKDGQQPDQVAALFD